MRDLNATELAVVTALELNREPITIRDMVEGGLERGRELKNALIDLEADGLIISRLPMVTTPLRLYELNGRHE